jgi:glycosyltransferase involved in cell wall biosynthesis
VNLFVVMAAYNESKMISKTIDGLKPVTKNIIVVDDCSDDGTFLVAEQAGAICVIRHPINLGQGAALQTGIEYALKCGADFIVTFDADGQHSPSDIAPMVASLAQSDADIALGSRFKGFTKELPFIRKLILKSAVVFTQKTTGLPFSDAHNGFRVLSRRFAQSFCFKQDRMAHASEILNFIARKKIPFIEYPVTIEYTEYSKAKGQSNSNLFHILIELVLGKLYK